MKIYPEEISFNNHNCEFLKVLKDHYQTDNTLHYMIWLYMGVCWYRLLFTWSYTLGSGVPVYEE